MAEDCFCHGGAAWWGGGDFVNKWRYIPSKVGIVPGVGAGRGGGTGWIVGF